MLFAEAPWLGPTKDVTDTAMHNSTRAWRQEVMAIIVSAPVVCRQVCQFRDRRSTEERETVVSTTYPPGSALSSLPSTTGSSAAVDRLFVNRSSSSKLSHMRTTRGRYEFMTRGFIFHPQGIKTRRLGGCRSYLSASMATISIR